MFNVTGRRNYDIYSCCSIPGLVDFDELVEGGVELEAGGVEQAAPSLVPQVVPGWQDPAPHDGTTARRSREAAGSAELDRLGGSAGGQSRALVVLHVYLGYRD